MINTNVKSGYFFYELFFYSTYSTVGVLIPFLIRNGKPTDIILSYTNRTSTSPFVDKQKFEEKQQNPQFFDGDKIVKTQISHINGILLLQN